jgi:hypothetical protein
MVDGEIVSLTVQQACVLQGFPFDFYDGLGLPQGAMFAQMGNAMTVDVVGGVMGGLTFFGVPWRRLRMEVVE